LLLLYLIWAVLAISKIYKRGLVEQTQFAEAGLWQTQVG
jgi:hypothetical protein